VRTTLKRTIKPKLAEVYAVMSTVEWDPKLELEFHLPDRRAKNSLEIEFTIDSLWEKEESAEKALILATERGRTIRRKLRKLGVLKTRRWISKLSVWNIPSIEDTLSK
jgi:hypothetical protein